MARRKLSPRSLKYSELINLDSNSRKDDNAEFQVQEANIAMQTAVLDAAKKVMNATRSLDLVKRSSPFQPLQVVGAVDKLALAKREYETLLTLQKELF